jgi:hypothetical protein
MRASTPEGMGVLWLRVRMAGSTCGALGLGAGWTVGLGVEYADYLRENY